MMPWWCLGVALAGWLGDGSGAYPTGPASGWSLPADVAWKQASASWANASPVVSEGLVCVTEEPTTLACFDLKSGALRWRASSDYGDTLAGEALARWQRDQADASAAQAELETLRPEYSRQQREARRGDAAAMAALPELSRRMDAARERLTAVEARLTPPDQGIIGYATPTPLAREGDLFAMFGQGVVSRFRKDGTRVWSVWHGGPATPMRGYHEGQSASLLWVGGTLVAPLGRLRGLDPATGAKRWDAGVYDHFGTPGVGAVAGTPVLVTPDGRVVRGSDGYVLAKGVCELLYVGPQVQGDVVYCIGNRHGAHETGPKLLTARAVQLVPGGAGLLGRELWSTTLGEGTLYASPVRWGEHLLVVTAEGTLRAVRRADGVVSASRELASLLGPGTVYPSPWVVGAEVYVASEQGRVLHWPGGDLSATPRVIELGAMRSTPVAAERSLYVRTLSSLIRVGR
jgi:outer membrane protein assembly factor BamB